MPTLGAIEHSILTTLDRAEIPVFSWLKHRNALRQFSTAQLYRAFHDLEMKELVRPIERGKYLVPLRAGAGHHWAESALVIAEALAPSEHYISFWAALAFYGLTDQVPNNVTVVIKTGRSRSVEYAGVLYQFVVRNAKYFSGTVKEVVGSTTGAQIEVTLASPEKAVLDSLDDEDLAGGLPEVLRALRRGVDQNTIDIDRMVKIALLFPTAATVMRLGYIWERLDLGGDVSPLLQRRPRGAPARLRPLSPTAEWGLDRRWNLKLNVSEHFFEELEDER